MSLREESERFAANVKVEPGLSPLTEQLVREALKLGYVTGVNDEIEREAKWRQERVDRSPIVEYNPNHER